MQLYEKIPLLRKARGLTQAELAERLDVSRQSAQKWETGLTSPDISKLPELAGILGVSVDALLDTAISRDDLLALAMSCGQANADSRSMPGGGVSSSRARPRRSMLDYLLMAPIGLGVALVIGMFYLFGAMLAGIGFVISLFTLCGGIAAVIVIFLNAANGVGAVLIAVSGVFLGLGLCAPFFWLSRWWWRVYLDLARRLTAKLKSFDLRSFIL